MITLTIIFLLGIYGYLAWNKPEFGVYAIILFLPSYLIRFNLFKIPMTFLEGMILVLFFVWLCRVYIDNINHFKSATNFRKGCSGIKNYFWLLLYYLSGFYHKNFSLKLSGLKFINSEFNKIRVFIFLFVLAGIFSLFVAPDWRASAGIFKAYIIEPLLFFIVMIGFINTKEKLIKLINTLGILVIIVSFYGIAQYIGGHNLIIESYQGIVNKRITSFFEYPNAVGLLLSPILGIYVVYFFEMISKKSKEFNQIKIEQKLFFIITVLSSGFLAILFAKSESGLLAFLVVLILYGFYKNRFSKFVSLFIVVSSCIVLFFSSTLFNSVLQKILLQDFSGQIRRQIYVESFEMLKDHFVFGAGLSGYKEAMLSYHKPVIEIGKYVQPVEIYLYPHNIFLNFWSEMGIFGMASIFSLICYLFYKTYKSRENIFAQMVFVSILILIIHGLVEVPFFKNDLAVLFWVLIGIFVIYKNNPVLKLK